MPALLRVDAIDISWGSAPAGVNVAVACDGTDCIVSAEADQVVYLCLYNGTECAFKGHIERGPRLQIRTNRIVGSTVWVDLVSEDVGFSLTDKWRYF